MRKFISKSFRWGFDDDGDFSLKVWFFIFSFYKWADPTIQYSWETGFKPLNNSNAKHYWRKTREEFGEAE